MLSDVMLDGHFRGLFNAQGFIRGTGYLIPDEHMRALRVEQTRPGGTPDDGTAIIGCNVAYRNYFHWMTQALPAIDFALRRDGQDRRTVLVLPVLNAWQEESLQRLGYAETKRIVIEQRETKHAFARVEFSEYLTGQAAFWLSMQARQTYARLRQSVPVSVPEGRRLYVARTDATSRPMRNEAALIEAMRQRGFEIVTPGTLSLGEQIRLFRNAGIVVGPHGAGMTNIVFCEPGTIIYELVPAQYTNSWFCNLAHICRLRYWADMFDPDGAWDPARREWQTDIPAVMRRLDEVDAVAADLLAAAKLQTITAMEFLRGKPGQISSLQTKAAASVPAPQGLFWRLRTRLLGG